LFQFLNPAATVTPTFSYPSWDAAFAEVARLAADKRTVIVLDEFTYVMLTDAVFLLREQLDEPRNYMAVLEAIGAGFHRLTEIATMSGINRSNITKYLAVLRELGYVERLVPATVRRPERSRQGRYVITDSSLICASTTASWRPHYAFFARQGFTPAAQTLAQEHNALLITLPQIEADMQRWLQAQAAQ